MRNNTEYEPVYRTETIGRKVRKRKHAEIETRRRRSLTEELIVPGARTAGKGVKLVRDQRVFLKKRVDLLDAPPCRKEIFGNDLG